MRKGKNGNLIAAGIAVALVIGGTFLAANLGDSGEQEPAPVETSQTAPVKQVVVSGLGDTPIPQEHWTKVAWAITELFGDEETPKSAEVVSYSGTAEKGTLYTALSDGSYVEVFFDCSATPPCSAAGTTAEKVLAASGDEGGEGSSAAEEPGGEGADQSESQAEGGSGGDGKPDSDGSSGTGKDSGSEKAAPSKGAGSGSGAGARPGSGSGSGSSEGSTSNKTAGPAERSDYTPVDKAKGKLSKTAVSVIKAAFKTISSDTVMVSPSSIRKSGGKYTLYAKAGGKTYYVEYVDGSDKIGIAEA